MNKIQVKAKCIGMDDEGKCIINVKGLNLHVSNLIDGETATVEITQKKNYTTTKVIRIEEKSKKRVAPECEYFNRCGGCQLQHLSAQSQKEFKQNSVVKLMGSFTRVNEILTMEEPYYYRNKVHSRVAYDEYGKIISGIYEENTHNVIPIEQCIIQDKCADEIIATIKGIMKKYKMVPYNEDKEQGFVRHILIKRGVATNQVMVVMVVSNKIFPGKNNFVSLLTKKHPEITTIVLNVNNKQTSVVLGDQEIVIYGKGYIEDVLCGRVFQISPKSFYQINPKQTEVLYNKAIEMANLKGNEVVLDAYSGIGTISLIVSDKVKSAIGVELNKEGVKDAVRNAKLNKITNVEFFNDDAGNFMVELAEQNKKIDTVFMDPPRSGSDEKFLSAVAKLGPKQVVYISCNPVTQERDLRFLMRQGYKVMEIQPVDMFPQTYHTECIVLIEKKS